uniref:TFIIS n=1 Tax=Plectus sambesii TaxID=2011161 RepID=A0A914W7Q6_9BILA
MSSCEEEVLRIARRLEKMNNGAKPMDGAMDLLRTLAKTPITIDVLTKTRIGMTINELRKKTTDEQVSKRAKALIKQWKNLLEQKNGKADAAEVGLPRTDSIASNMSDQDGSSSRKASPPTPTVRQTAIPPRPLEGDEVRVKCAKMLVDALKCGDMPDGTLDPEDLAARIEEKLFDSHRGTTDKYKASLRSRVFNLRDKKNPALRENVLTGVVAPERFANVLTGVVAPERFAVMTTEEMASNEMKQMRDKFTKQAIDDHQMSVQQGTPSDMFKCGKCLKKNCTYTQVQTRSADEPMTTFVFCRECGNRWKFC